MFDLIHQARSRLIESPSFTGDKILATILFEQTRIAPSTGRTPSPSCGSRSTSCRSSRSTRGLPMCNTASS